MDMDLDDLDVPSLDTKRTNRFAPKNSKPKPNLKPKAESSSSASVPTPVPPVTTQEEFDDSKTPPVVSISAAKFEDEITPSHLSPSANGAVKMDIVPESRQVAEADSHRDNDDEDEEDRVVREIDVFFTPSIDPNTQLYVLQYPLRPCWRPYELDERCKEVRVKPTSAEVEVALSVDVESQNFDPDADDRMRNAKQVLSSSWKLPLTTGYAVGVLMDNKLHLNPVHEVVQLRPSLQHSKSGGSRKKINTISSGEGMIKSEELKEEKTVVPSKKPSPGAMNEQNKEIEEWIPLTYHGTTSDFSARYVRRMVTQENSHIQFSMSPYDYINSLCPGTSSDKLRQKAPSIKFLLSLPLEDRYKTWLLEGPTVHKFDALKHLAPNDSDEDVIEVLQKLAQLVQGLWVAKSSLLQGTDVGLEVLARNWVLLLFSKNAVVNVDQLPKKQALHTSMVKELNSFAVRPSSKDWKFKEPQDTSFIRLHPNVVKKQEQVWDRLERQITEYLTSNNANKGAPKSSNRPTSRTLMSDETREALPKALQKLLQVHKVCSFNQICLRLREMAVSKSSHPRGDAREAIAAANAVDAPQDELLKIINQVAIKIHDVFVLKSSPDHPQYDGLRQVVIDLFLAEGPNAKIRKAAIIEAARMKLKRDITENEIKKVLSELCVSKNTAWVLKSGEGNPK